MLKQQLIRRFELKLIRKSDLFDENYYRKAAGIPEQTDAIAHYYDGGWRNADPSMRFNQENYLEANPDVLEAGLCPLAHYLRYGYRERRRLAVNSADECYHRYAAIRELKRLFYELRYFSRIRKNRDARILVVLHMFYENSCYEIIEYLKNLRKYHYDLVITTVEGKDIDYIRRVFHAFKKDSEIRVYPNLGFDIAPYLDVLDQKKTKDYDIVIKVQSKRLFEHNGVLAATMFVRGRDWFLYLFESVLGARYIHRNIDCLKNNGEIELIAAKNLLMNDPPHKERMTLRKLEKLNLSLRENYVFVAGTCFAIKGSTAKEKHTGLLPADSFEKSERNYFSTAHALERYLTGIIPEKAQKGNKVCAFRRFLSDRKGREVMKIRGLRVAMDERFHFDDDFILRFLEHAPVFHYEIIEKKVKDLYIILDDEKVPLCECAPYLYLQGKKEEYIHYCLEHRKTDYMELSREEFEKEIIENGTKRFEKLIEQLNQTGYDEKEPVVICREGQILDGQHRACWYMNRYGQESMIRVLYLQIEP